MGEARAAHQPAVTAPGARPRGGGEGGESAAGAGGRGGGAGGSGSLQVAPELPQTHPDLLPAARRPASLSAHPKGANPRSLLPRLLLE